MRRGRGELIRDLNRALVFNLAREQGVTSRASIARISGLSPSTVTSIVGSLLADGLLVEEGRDESRSPAPGVVGRPATRLRVDPAARHVIGVKLAPDSLTFTVTDLDATPLAMVRFGHGGHALRDQVGDLFQAGVEQVLAAAGLPSDAPIGIGVGVPGIVDPVSGLVSRSPLPEWTASDLGTVLEERLGIPVLIDNDVNTLTVAEHLFGAGQGVAHLVVLSIGRGIGMGVVADGIVVRGWRGALGEIGHVPVDPDGRRCWCGRRGCLEAVAAEPGIVREVLAATGRVVSASELAHAAEGDERVGDILATAGRRVGRALAMAIAILDPQLVIVSGEGVRLGPRYLDGLRDGVHEELDESVAHDMVIEPWGDEAWARGAASLVLRELFHPAHLRDEGRSPLGAITPGSDPRPIAAHRGQGGRRR